MERDTSGGEEVPKDWKGCARVEARKASAARLYIMDKLESCVKKDENQPQMLPTWDALGTGSYDLKRKSSSNFSSVFLCALCVALIVKIKNV